MNVSFDGLELSHLGLSVRSIEGRGMPAFAAKTVALSSGRVAETGPGGYEAGSTVFHGQLSADTDNWDSYTHENWLARVDYVKSQLAPHRGFKKLVVTGDRPSRFRWARLSELSFSEDSPVFHRPFQQVQLNFQNLEPYWREITDNVIVTTAPETLPNDGSNATKPIVAVEVVEDIEAQVGSTIQPVTLFQIDDLSVNWKGAGAAGKLSASSILVLDSETLTARRGPTTQEATEDCIRYYHYSGDSASLGEGFPLIEAGDSEVTYIHPSISRLTFSYDLLHL